MADVFRKLQDLKEKGKSDINIDELAKLKPSEIVEKMRKMPKDKLDEIVKKTDEEFTKIATKFQLDDEARQAMEILLKHKLILLLVPFSPEFRDGNDVESKIWNMLRFHEIKMKESELVDTTGGAYTIVCVENFGAYNGEKTFDHAIHLKEIYNVADINEEATAEQKLNIINTIMNKMITTKTMCYAAMFSTEDFDTPEKLALALSFMNDELKNLGLKSVVMIADISEISHGYRGDYIGKIL
jgi:hypothetical protein